MKTLPVQSHPDLLVGMENADDAGVFRLTPEIALIQMAGVCLCCQALFDSVANLAPKYGLELEKLLADLEMAAAGRSYR